MNQRELEALAERVVDEWEDIEDESLREGHRATLERLIAENCQRAVESAVEKACKAVCGYHPGPVHSASCDLIRRAFSPASPAEEKRQESKP